MGESLLWRVLRRELLVGLRSKRDGDVGTYWRMLEKEAFCRE